MREVQNKIKSSCSGSLIDESDVDSMFDNNLFHTNFVADDILFSHQYKKISANSSESKKNTK